ncbi:hypothetical protein H4582DRAFT_2076642 [Lactarius indigo]|nr:hypothetical protein H4582DRAFT_2076642 [Lactarius indigo]
MLTGVSVSEANDHNLLGASYQLYRHAETNYAIFRTVSYALPVALHGHFRTARSGGAAAGQAGAVSEELVIVLSIRDDTMMPAHLRQLWDIFGTIRTLPGGPRRIHESFTLITVLHAASFTIEQVNNRRYDPSDPGAGADVDIQYAKPWHRFLSWLLYTLIEESVLQPVGISYGIDEKNYPKDKAMFICFFVHAARRGGRGVSIYFGSDVDRGNCIDGSPVHALCPPSSVTDLGDKYHGLYDAAGCSFPDIAAQAVKISVFLRGNLVLVVQKLLGTRASWRASSRCLMTTDSRKARLGSLIPLLYGRNTDGISAIAGWDRDTGLGTLDFRLQPTLPDYDGGQSSTYAPAPTN